MKKNAFKRIGNFSKRICSLLLAFATVFTLFSVNIPENVEAAGKKGYAPKNGMVLKILMGSNTTDQISYFSIRYYDTNDILRTHILRPDKATYSEGFNTVRKYVSNTTVDKKVSFLGKDGNGKGLGINFGNYLTNAKPLVPMTTSYFYFEPYFQFKNIVGIKFLALYKDGGKNQIDIQDISLYKVDELYDVDMVSNFSGEYYIDFSGKKVMSTKIQRSFVWSQTDTIFDFDSLVYSDGSAVDFGAQYYKATYEKNTGSVATKRELDDSAQYTFQINIADLYGAGAEFLNTPVLTSGRADMYQGWYREPLELEATYKDNDGYIHTQKIPVMLSAFYKAITEGGNVTQKSFVSGLMQQGDSLVFDTIYLNAKDIDISSFVLKYGRDTVKGDIAYNYTYSSNLKIGDSDSLKIKSIIVYETSTTKYSASVESGFLVPTISGTPVWYFKTTQKSETELTEESTFAIPFAKCTGSENFEETTSPGQFLITLKTDKQEAASTKDPINVKIRYKSLKGEERDTELILIANAVGNYYGYWPSTGGDGNVAYAVGTYRGLDLSFVVDLPDIDTFVGMTFALSNDATDDWQCCAIGIFEIKELGSRQVKWEAIKSGNLFTDRVISRNNKLENISPTLDGPFLVEPGKPTYVEFEHGTSVIDDNDINWEDYKYQMSYEEATQNLGFTKSRAVYSVEVSVAGDIVNGMVNEDCGSKNQFYFKLIFEDGSSGYVLANQQLTSDGFTSGVKHTFTITTNRDMGNLSAIKILPENQEASEPFDKLKIDSILVTKSNGEGLALSWRIDVDDWITIDYQDGGAKNSTRGQKGRTENELAQTFKVTSKGYSLNLMFAVETLSYIDTPFDGKLVAYIDYLDSSDALQTKPIEDLVGAFCEYAGKPSEIKTFTPVNDMPTFTGTAINRNYILSPNHTDRFFVTLTDVKSISRIRFTIQSTTAGRWRVGGVTGYRVLSRGNKVLNDNNEYQYNGEVEPICQSQSSIPYDVQYTASGNGASLNVIFGQNTIDVDLSNTWISSISYVPQSNDDSINVYAYMRADADDINAYEMKMAATYALADETTRETINTLSPNKDYSMFYAKDIKVSGMRTLRRIGLKADSYDPQFAPCEYVIVEHVRSGVVINTYFLNFGGQDMGTSSYYYYVKPSDDNIHERERQTLMFMLSSDSTTTKLVNGTTDLAVCLNYTSTNDPEGKTLTSPNLFVSDLGITTLKAGDIVSITFDQRYIKDIQSITFVGQGGASNAIRIKSARVSTETIDKDGVSTYKNFYSFGNEMQGFVTYSPKNMMVTSTTSKNVNIPSGTQKSVGVLTIGLMTQSGNSGLASGTKIRTKIGYNDDFNMAKEMTIDDITALVVKGTFNPGDTAYANILINGITSIRYIEVEPYGLSSGSSWALDGITTTLSVSSAGVTEERRINKVVEEGKPEMVGFGNIKIQVVAYVSKTGTTAKERRGYSSASDISEGILMYLGNDIVFEPTIDDSISGLNVKCVSVGVTATGSQVTSDVTNKVISKKYGSQDLKSFLFTPDAVGDYRITISSKEISSINVEINISVLSESEPEKQEQPIDPEEPVEQEEPEEPIVPEEEVM